LQTNTLEKKCWIGAGATILPGITAGENPIIGACSVVTKDIPYNVIAIPYKIFAFLCLVSAKRRFVIKKTTFFNSKNHLFLMKKGGFFIIETAFGRNQTKKGKIFSVFGKTFPLLVVFFFLWQPSTSVIASRKTW